MSETPTILPNLKAPLRWAKRADILRMGLISYVGFQSTPDFTWLSPYHKQYPEDALMFERVMTRQYLEDTASACIVIEDTPMADEASFSDAIVPADDPAVASSVIGKQNSENVVVGVAIWSLENDSVVERVEQYRMNHETDDSSWPDIPATPFDCLKRDQHQDHGRILGNLQFSLARKHLTDCGLRLQMLVVHPAYQRRGHGKALLNWGMEFAKLDIEPVGVVAADSGMPLYKAMGWVSIHSYEVAGDEIAPQGTKGCIMKFYPQMEQGSEIVLNSGNSSRTRSSTRVAVRTNN